jgi:4-carboxymuconolactone decarboxylase
MDDRERRAKGTGIRRAVLGDAHVDRALAGRTAFNADFQDLVTRYAWSEVWARPGLPRHTRRLVTLALLVALRQHDEIKLHVRSALADGVSADEIKEVLLQCAVYAGVPAANSAFRLAEEVLAERT